MVRERHNAHVAYHDSVFLVNGGQNTSAQEASSMGVERLRVLSEAETLPSPTGEMTEYPAGSLVNGAMRMRLWSRKQASWRSRRQRLPTGS